MNHCSPSISTFVATPSPSAPRPRSIAKHAPVNPPPLTWSRPGYSRFLAALLVQRQHSLAQPSTAVPEECVNMTQRTALILICLHVSRNRVSAHLCLLVYFLVHFTVSMVSLSLLFICIAIPALCSLYPFTLSQSKCIKFNSRLK